MHSEWKKITIGDNKTVEPLASYKTTCWSLHICLVVI